MRNSSVFFLSTLVMTVPLAAVNTTITVINRANGEIEVNIYPVGTCQDHKHNRIAADNTDSWTVHGCDTKSQVWFPDGWHVDFGTSLAQSDCTVTARRNATGGYYVDIEKKDPTPRIIGAGTATTKETINAWR